MRLTRTDHRRIAELLGRLARRHRSVAGIRPTLVGELVAHEAAASRELLPFAADRLEGYNGRAADSLHQLQLAAAELDESLEPASLDIVTRAMAMFAEHVAVEEQEILEPLSQVTEVSRLREAGDADRRRRDAALKSRGERRRQYRRPSISRAELYERARRRGIRRRSSMTREQLVAALEDSS